jgi:DNA-binding CsgD family transcriptional regulator
LPESTVWSLSVAKFAEVVTQTLGGFRVWLVRSGGAESAYPSGRLTLLTPRELEILWMVADRLTNGQIACYLGISANTVKNHVAALLRKLGVQSRADLYTGVNFRVTAGVTVARTPGPAAQSGTGSKISPYTPANGQ